MDTSDGFSFFPLDVRVLLGIFLSVGIRCSPLIFHKRALYFRFSLALDCRLFPSICFFHFLMDCHLFHGLSLSHGYSFHFVCFVPVEFIFSHWIFIFPNGFSFFSGQAGEAHHTPHTTLPITGTETRAGCPRRRPASKDSPTHAHTASSDGSAASAFFEAFGGAFEAAAFFVLQQKQ